MANRREAPPPDLADSLRALLAIASPELFGTVPSAVAISVSGESLTVYTPTADRASPNPLRRTFAGSGHSTVSLSGTVGRVKRARDLTLALLTTDGERVMDGARSTVNEGSYTTSHRLTVLKVTAVETQLAGDAATARITLHLETVIETSRTAREGETAPTSTAQMPEGTS
jgi:hypothetical protein